MMLFSLRLPDPKVPDNPAEDRACATPAHDGDGGNTLLVYANKGADEDSHGRDVLYNDSGIGDKRPEVIKP